MGCLHDFPPPKCSTSDGGQIHRFQNKIFKIIGFYFTEDIRQNFIDIVLWNIQIPFQMPQIIPHIRQRTVALLQLCQSKSSFNFNIGRSSCLTACAGCLKTTYSPFSSSRSLAAVSSCRRCCVLFRLCGFHVWRCGCSAWRGAGVCF